MGSLCVSRGNSSDSSSPRDMKSGKDDAIIVDDTGIGGGPKPLAVPERDIRQLFPSDVSSSDDECELSFHSALEDVHRMHKAKFGESSLIHEKRVVFVSLYTLSTNFDAIPLHIWQRSIVVAAADREWCEDAVKRMESEGVDEGTQLSRKAATVFTSAKTKAMVYSMKRRFLRALLEKDAAFERQQRSRDEDGLPEGVGVPTSSHRPRSSSASKSAHSLGSADVSDDLLVDSRVSEESGCVLWFSPTSMESLSDWIEASKKVSKLRALFKSEEEERQQQQKRGTMDEDGKLTETRPTADSLLSVDDLEEEHIRKMSSGSATLGTPVPTDPGKTPSLMDRSTPESKERTTLSGSRVPLTHDASSDLVIGRPTRFSLGGGTGSSERARFTTINSDSPSDGAAHTSDILDPAPKKSDVSHQTEDAVSDEQTARKEEEDESGEDGMVVKRRLRDDSVARLDHQIEELEKRMKSATVRMDDLHLRERKRMLLEVRKTKIVDREKTAILNGEDWEDSVDIAMRNRLFQFTAIVPDGSTVDTYPLLKPLILDKHWWKFHYVTPPNKEDTVNTAHTAQQSTALVSHGVTFEMEWIADDYSVSSSQRTETSTTAGMEMSSKLPMMSAVNSNVEDPVSEHHHLTTDSSGRWLSATKTNSRVDLNPKASRDTTASGTTEDVLLDAGLDGEAKHRSVFSKQLMDSPEPEKAEPKAIEEAVAAKVSSAGMQSRESVNLASVAVTATAGKNNNNDIEPQTESVTPAVSSRPDGSSPAMPMTVHTIDNTMDMTAYIMKAHSDPTFLPGQNHSLIAKLKDPKSKAHHVCRRRKCKYHGSYLEVSIPKYNALCESVIENLYNTASLNFDAVSEIFYQSNPHTLLPMRSFDLKTWRDAHLNQTL